MDNNLKILLPRERRERRWELRSAWENLNTGNPWVSPYLFLGGVLVDLQTHSGMVSNRITGVIYIINIYMGVALE